MMENPIAKLFIKPGRYGMDWIDVAQDRDQWSNLVNTVMNLWFHEILEIS
jgi:hypothetical protein